MQSTQVLRALCAVLFLTSAAALGETVQTRLKIGDNVEGMTWAPNGTWQGSALAIDGNDVIAISLAANASKRGRGDRLHDDNGNHYGLGLRKHLRGNSFAKAFDVLQLPIEGHTPRGIVYSPLNQHFYFSSKYPTAEIYETDDAGNLLRSFVPQVPDLPNWLNWEGMTWIPADAPKHANTIAAIGHHSTDFVSHIYFLRTDGSVEGELIPAPGTPVETYLCGIGYQPPGRILVTACDKQVYALDINTGMLTPDGNPLFTTPDLGESVIVDHNGAVWTSGYEEATLRAYDGSYNRLPDLDVKFQVGFGISLGAIAWDFDAGEILTMTRARGRLAAIRSDLRAGRFLLDSTDHPENTMPGGFSYLSPGQIAIANRPVFVPPDTVLWPGVTVLKIATNTVESRLTFRPTWIPTDDPFAAGTFRAQGVAPLGGDRFLVSVRGEATHLRVVTRTGTPDTDQFATGLRPTRLDDLVLTAGKGFNSLQTYDAGQGLRILTGPKIFDGSGALVHTIDEPALGLTDRFSGALWIGGNHFVASDGDTSTLIVFTIP